MARLLSNPKALVAALMLVVMLAGLSAVGMFAAGNDQTKKTSATKATGPGKKGAGKGAPGGGPPGMPPALVRVENAKVKSLQQKWEVIGRLREQRRTIVAAEQSGKFIEFNIDDGATVLAPPADQARNTDTQLDKKYVLARIDDVWARLSQATAQARLDEAKSKVKVAQDGVAVAKADVTVANAQIEQAQRDLNYLNDLAKQGSAKPKEVKDAQTNLGIEQAGLKRAEAKVIEAQTQVAAAQAQVALTESELRRVETEMRRLIVTAPFDGVVVRKLAEVGQWAAPGTPVAEIISRGKIDAVIDVPERYINNLEIDADVAVFVEPLDMQLTGQVRSIIPSGSSAARTFPVKVSLDDKDAKLKPGMSITARIPTSGKAQLLTVPRDAVQRSARGTIIWIVKDGKAFRVPIKILFIAATDYAIKILPSHSGPPLVDGTAVIIEGGEKLMFPGQVVKVVTP